MEGNSCSSICFDAVNVKNEPVCGVNEQVHVKEEVVESLKEEAAWEDSAAAGSAAALASLYAGHEVKDELVLGPEGLQPRDVAFTLYAAQALAVKEHHELRDCVARLERIEDPAPLSIQQPHSRHGAGQEDHELFIITPWQTNLTNLWILQTCPLPSRSNVLTEAQDAAASTSATPFAEPPTIAAPKSQAQIQREYRKRTAASRTPAQAIAARKSNAERQRKLRKAAKLALVSGSLESTTASSSRSGARSNDFQTGTQRQLTHQEPQTSAVHNHTMADQPDEPMDLTDLPTTFKE